MYWKPILAIANFIREDLIGAYLPYSNFCQSNLFQAQLKSAIVNNGKFNCTNLFLANLERANLYFASLVGVNPIKANLQETNVNCAALIGAVFEWTNLDRACNINLGRACLDRLSINVDSLPYLK